MSRLYNSIKSIFKPQKTTGKGAISSVNPNVPKTTYQKKLRDLKIVNQEVKATKAKLDQTKFESKQNMPFTFDPARKNVTRKSKKKEKTKTKVFNVPKSFVGFKDFNKGGRVGKKFGGSGKKSNIQKIKETFGPRQSQAKNLKSVDKKKNPGLAKLPIEVRNKMGYAAKGGRAMLKTGSKFPDLNKDGKITKADILMGRGVIKKNKKKVI